MRKIVKSVAFGFLLVAGITAASVLYAEGSKHSDRGVMSQGGMGGMMGMMSQMRGMMEHCNQMMQGRMDEDGSEKPNEQWREEAPVPPRKNS